MNSNLDLFGTAILDYYSGYSNENILTETNISEEDELPIEYLFRSYQDMPKLEQKALQLARGKVLEIGCGAGSHGLYLQNEKNMDVTSIDISPKAIKTCQLRGLKNTICQDIMKVSGKYDTLLLLMNGAGLCGRLRRMDIFLQHLKLLLKENGQILMDSSDIIYMFDQNEDGSYNIPLYYDYYGELDYTVKYKDKKEPPFDWLYIDYNNLHKYAITNGLNCELIVEGDHYDYLARLTTILKNP